MISIKNLQVGDRVKCVANYPIYGKYSNIVCFPNDVLEVVKIDNGCAFVEYKCLNNSPISVEHYPIASFEFQLYKEPMEKKRLILSIFFLYNVYVFFVFSLMNGFYPIAWSQGWKSMFCFVTIIGSAIIVLPNTLDSKK